MSSKLTNLVKGNSDNMRNLLHRINENLELKYENLRGLSGLHAKDLRKVLNIKNPNYMKQNTLSSIMKNPQSAVLIEGKVKDQFKGNEYLICDIDSLDIWVKFKLALDS